MYSIRAYYFWWDFGEKTAVESSLWNAAWHELEKENGNTSIRVTGSSITGTMSNVDCCVCSCYVNQSSINAHSRSDMLLPQDVMRGPQVVLENTYQLEPKDNQRYA